MKRFILTGTPGSGKTSLILALEAQWHSVVREAATDIIAIEQTTGNSRPWEHQSFVDKILNLQIKRQMMYSTIQTEIQFFDRSPICTYALAKYLNFEVTSSLQQEIARIQELNLYRKNVFFIENLGFIQETEARKINFDEALKFEEVHKNAYKEFGFNLISIPSDDLYNRTETILKHAKI